MKNSQELKVGVLVAVVALLASPIIVSIPKAFADNICIGFLACGAAGGSGGRGGDTGDAISGDIGPGGYVLQKIIQTLEMNVVEVLAAASLVVVAVTTVLMAVEVERLQLT